jgi:sporulation protein YlmC with PRC-barrel domain
VAVRRANLGDYSAHLFQWFRQIVGQKRPGILGPSASAANPPEQTLTSLPSGALPISDYYNQSVYDPQDNKIGDIKDLLADKDGKIDAAIVGVGGFLGAGEKNVAVPFNALKLTDKNGKRYLVMNTTKEALKSAPGYTFDRTASQWVPAKQGWSAPIATNQNL